MSAPAATLGKSALSTRVDRLLAHLTLAQKVGQMFMFSFDGTDADPEVMGMVRDWGAGGLILYRPNVVSAPQLRALPTVRRSLRQLERVDLVPMRAAIRADVDALMVTHAVIPALDASGTPASLSRRIITGFIRGSLGYRGLIISDALAMGAITTHLSIAMAAVQAAAAGNDIVLVAFYQGLPPATMHAALDAVLHAVEDRRISTATIDVAARHVLLLKARLGLL